MITKTHKLVAEAIAKAAYYNEIEDQLEFYHDNGDTCSPEALATAAIQAYDSCLTAENERLRKALEEVDTGIGICKGFTKSLPDNERIMWHLDYVREYLREALGDTHNDET